MTAKQFVYGKSNLPNFEVEEINFLASDRFFFEPQDLVSSWYYDNLPEYRFYHCGYWGGGLSLPTQKIIIFKGDERVAYVCFTDSYLSTIYTMPKYRNQGWASCLLGIIPQDLKYVVTSFSLVEGDFNNRLNQESLTRFYEKKYPKGIRL